MKVLDLFSGIGGFSLGLERAGMETVAFCEIDPFCQKVLKKHWPDVPIYEDVRTLDYEGSVDLICGGYPCQPFSVAGKRKGEEDDRHLWPSMFELIKKYRPRWVIGENVAGHITMGLDNVLADLEGEAYTARAFVIPACAVNGKHRRDRVWIVAYDDRGGQPRSCTGAEEHDTSICRENVENPAIDRRRKIGTRKPSTSSEVATNTASNASNGKRKSGSGRQGLSIGGRDSEYVRDTSIKGFPDWSGGEVGQPRPITEFERSSGREVELSFCGVAHGVSRRVDRLRALGNAVVPQIPEIIGHAIMETYR